MRLSAFIHHTEATLHICLPGDQLDLEYLGWDSSSHSPNRSALGIVHPFQPPPSAVRKLKSLADVLPAMEEFSGAHVSRRGRSLSGGGVGISVLGLFEGPQDHSVLRPYGFVPGRVRHSPPPRALVEQKRAGPARWPDSSGAILARQRFYPLAFLGSTCRVRYSAMVSMTAQRHSRDRASQRLRTLAIFRPSMAMAPLAFRPCGRNNSKGSTERARAMRSTVSSRGVLTPRSTSLIRFWLMPPERFPSSV